jgi:hypothetical protein
MSKDQPDAGVWTLLLCGRDVLRDEGQWRSAGGRDPVSRLFSAAQDRQLSVVGRYALIAWLIAGDEAAVRHWPPGPVLYAEAVRRPPPAGIMCAAPVSLMASGDHLIMHGPGALALDPGEREALTAALAAGLEGGDPAFRVESGQWFLEAGEPPLARWYDPDAVGGRDMLALMPGGPTAAPLRTLMTEAQMILHEHPVNLARTAAGRPAANGLWPWGWCAASLPAPSWPPLALRGQDAYARALAAMAGVPVADANPLRPAGSALIILQVPDEAAAFADWRREFGCQWCEPLLDAVRRGRIEALRVVTTAGRCFEHTRRPRLSFWRRWRR